VGHDHRRGAASARRAAGAAGGAVHRQLDRQLRRGRGDRAAGRGARRSAGGRRAGAQHRPASRSSSCCPRTTTRRA
jgi:hypothetical protein